MITHSEKNNEEKRMKALKLLLPLTIIPFLVSFSFGQESQPARKTINVPRGQLANLPFSDAVMVGNTLYISGRGGIDLHTMKAPDDPKKEAKLLLDDFKSVLAQADMTMDDLVSVTVYCSDVSLYKVFNEVYRTYFSKDFPARAFIGSGPLLFGIRFEMQGIAVKEK
jgi:2-iminobutanoate/2-iminopropanoate deaminase